MPGYIWINYVHLDIFKHGSTLIWSHLVRECLSFFSLYIVCVCIYCVCLYKHAGKSRLIDNVFNNMMVYAGMFYVYHNKNVSLRNFTGEMVY